MPPFRAYRLTLLLILAFCALMGLAVAVDFHVSPFGSNPALDEESYVKWGLRISAGDWLGSQVFYQEPLYPYFLGLVFRLCGDSLLVARLLQVLITTGTAFLVSRLGTRLFSAKVGLLAAALFSLVGVVHLYSAELIKATLVTHGSAWLCLLGVIASERERTSSRVLFAMGALFGCLMLLRGNFVAMLPLFLLWIAVLSLKSGRWLPAVSLVLGLSVTLVPVMVRNHAISNEWVVTTSQGGQNFFIGNSEYANGSYAPIPFVRATPMFEATDFQHEAERRAGHPLKPGEVSAFWFREAFAFLEQHPQQGLALTWRKLLLLIHPYEIPDNYSLVCMRETFIPELTYVPLSVGWLVTPALIGLWLFRRQKGLFFPAVFALSYGATVVAFFVVSRYRMPALPALAVFASAFFVNVFNWARARSWRPLGLGLAVLALGWLGTSRPLAFMAVGDRLEAQCYSSIGVTLSGSGRADEAVPYLEHAVTLQPENGELAFNLGATYHALGRIDDALKAYRRALELKPGQPQAEFNAGLILLIQNDPRSAEPLLRMAIEHGLTNPGAPQALERARALLQGEAPR